MALSTDSPKGPPTAADWLRDLHTAADKGDHEEAAYALSQLKALNQKSNQQDMQAAEKPELNSGFANDVAGIGDAAIHGAEGLGEMAANPMQTAVGIGQAVQHPLQAAGKVLHSVNPLSGANGRERVEHATNLVGMLSPGMPLEMPVGEIPGALAQGAGKAVGGTMRALASPKKTLLGAADKLAGASADPTEAYLKHMKKTAPVQAPGMGPAKPPVPTVPPEKVIEDLEHGRRIETLIREEKLKQAQAKTAGVVAKNQPPPPPMPPPPPPPPDPVASPTLQSLQAAAGRTPEEIARVNGNTMPFGVEKFPIPSRGEVTPAQLSVQAEGQASAIPQPGMGRADAAYNTPPEGNSLALLQQAAKKAKEATSKVPAALAAGAEDPETLARMKVYQQQGFSLADAQEMAKQGVAAPREALEKIMGKRLPGLRKWI